MDPKMSSKNITVTTTIHSTSTLSLPTYPSQVASFEKRRPSTTSSSTSLDGPIFLTEPTNYNNSPTLLSLILSRGRFVLHLSSAILAFSLIGSLAAAVIHYNSTKDLFLFVAGHLAWPQALEMEDSMVLLGLGIAMAVLSTGLLLASSVRRFRRNTILGLSTSAIISVALFALSLGATIFYYTYTPQFGKSFWAWTCAHREEKHPDVDYALVCGELRFAWGCAVGVVVVSVLMAINVGISAVHLVCLKREGRRRRGQSWMIARSSHVVGGEKNCAVRVYSNNGAV